MCHDRVCVLGEGAQDLLGGRVGECAQRLGGLVSNPGGHEVGGGICLQGEWGNHVRSGFPEEPHPPPHSRSHRVLVSVLQHVDEILCAVLVHHLAENIGDLRRREM